MSHLAQVNIARLKAPLTDPMLAGFVAKLDEINALAEASQGFIWRYQTSEGNATSLRPYDDDLIIFNMSVWATVQDLHHYIYAMESMHRDVLKQRKNWFQPFDGPYMALWWIADGQIPTVEEAKSRLEYLREHGETSIAFSFKKSFPAPDTINI